MNPVAGYDLQSLNTLGVPSWAEFFVSTASEKEVVNAVAWAESRKLNLSILGGGSNVLLQPITAGLVLQPAILGKRLVKETETVAWVEACAGESWDEFVSYCLTKDLYGLENLTLIPGTVGAAPIQNIGAYGVEVSELIESVRVYDRERKVFNSLCATECGFGYRDSLFKSQAVNRYIVLSVTFRLSKTPKIKVDYPALKNFFENGVGSITAQNVADAVKKIRLEKLPQPEVLPNAGSFFKNPVIENALAIKLKQQYPEIVIFPAGKSASKLAAGWLIDYAGWKGKELFEVKVHDKQALVLTNPNRKPLENVLSLAEAIKSEISNKFCVELEIEPQVLGCPA